ncbi:MAG: Farnesyl diphosphate synthase [Lentisphaerae bacterium ADurb.Bin242]|nr:MAG: Farnesyl diphosphate synthase [Lentisphaerae bacterium ADurb.Bin242]
MDDLLKGELGRVSSDIIYILANDLFPSAIYPECLCSAVRSYPMRGGKRIRPALVLWSCGALGGIPEEAMNAAAAVEIYHSWTLVHDDIIDEDDVRRGLATTHVELSKHARVVYPTKTDADCAKFGRNLAILTGDIQQAWAVDILMRSTEKGCPPALVMELVRRLQNTVNRELISGEALDVELTMRELKAVTREDILKTISGKTVCLLKYSVQCGGAIALRTTDFRCPELQHLVRYAESLGFAFQLRDDYLGVFGDVRSFGKAPCSDFQESKPTLLYLEAMNALPESGRKELLSLTALPEYPMEKVQRIRELLTSSGAADKVLKLIAGYTEQAEENLHLLSDNKYKKLLRALSGYLLNREV